MFIFAGDIRKAMFTEYFYDWRVTLILALAGIILVYAIWPAPCQQVDSDPGSPPVPTPILSFPGLPSKLGWFYEPMN